MLQLPIDDHFQVEIAASFYRSNIWELGAFDICLRLSDKHNGIG
jgi:hypothetical protein